MADTYFVGLRATGDVVSNELPGDWRAGILRLYPNGQAPLTGLTSLMKSKKSEFHYHWWTKTLNTQRAAITGLYSDALLATTYLATFPTGASAGDTVFLKMAAAGAALFRVGHQVLIRDASNYALDTVGKVINVVTNGASSYVAVRLTEADDNDSDNSKYLGTAASPADTLLVIGNMNPQGSTRPESITQGPTEHENYTQIFRNALDLSRTIEETKFRTAQAYAEAKKDCLEQHSLEIEKALFWSVLYSGTGSNGKPEYATRGLMSWIREFGTVQDFSLDTAAAYAGRTWLQAGDQWIDEHLEEIFRYGSRERLAFCGSGSLLGIQQLAKDIGTWNMTPKTLLWGSNVTEWTNPFGMITFMTHPLFSYEATTRNSMVIIEPANLEYRYVTDTKYEPDIHYGKGGGTGLDGRQEGYLTECGLEIHFPETTGYLNGIGVNNEL
jgi:hypothetical protein